MVYDRICMCLCCAAFFVVVCFMTLSVSQTEPGQRSGHSDWLRAGRLKGRGSSPGRVKHFLVSMLSRPALGPLSLLSNACRGIFPQV
jgi:hypothetical protein